MIKTTIFSLVLITSIILIVYSIGRLMYKELLNFIEENEE